MIIAYHVILSAYGFWLPNDPRGSWSDYVRAYEVWKFGAATKVETRRSVAHVAHDREQRLAAKRVLKYPPVVFTGVQARAVARGLAFRVQHSGVEIYACAIQPEHVHLVIGRHRCRVEMLVNQLKGAASQQLRREGIHPFQEQPGVRGTLPSVWANGYWKVFIDDEAHLAKAIAYVEANPVKSGFKPQRWEFVKTFVG